MPSPLLNQPLLIFDGAIGTELYQRGFYINRPFEELNLSNGRQVQDVHSDYIDAGAQVLTTNTFGVTRAQLKNFDIEDKQKAIIREALRIVNAALDERHKTRGEDVFVGFSMGPLGDLLEPLGPVGLDEACDEFRQVAKIAASDGRFDCYILETFSNIDELLSAIKGVRSVDPITPILASVHARSSQTAFIDDFVARIDANDDVQLIGFNCSEGPSDLYTVLKKHAARFSKPIVVQPNAGLPRQVNGRYFYMTSPDYLAKYAKRFVEAGAHAVGGCCGTGPKHVRAIARAVQMVKSQRLSEISRQAARRIEVASYGGHGGETQRAAAETRRCEKSFVLGELRAGRKVHSVEVLSPKGTDLGRFYEHLEQLKRAGLRMVNIPDGARASTRVSSLHLASHIRQHQPDLQAMPHFTTRDRNLIALQADLLGAYVNGVRDVLLITGDPPKLGTNKDATGVYDIDSIGLTYLAHCLNQGRSPTGEQIGQGTAFGIGVAANPTAISLEQEVQRWRYKVESGADFAVTQPIFDPEAYRHWKDLIADTYRPHLIGIWPLISLRNAEFMANEIPGVHVPTWVLDEMAKAGDDAREARKRGLTIARHVMDELSNECEGFCVSAPLGRVEMALELLP